MIDQKILKMQAYESKQAIFKYVDLLLWVAVKTVRYGQKDTQEQLLIELESIEEDYFIEPSTCRIYFTKN